MQTNVDLGLTAEQEEKLHNSLDLASLALAAGWLREAWLCDDTRVTSHVVRALYEIRCAFKVYDADVLFRAICHGGGTEPGLAETLIDAVVWEGMWR